MELIPQVNASLANRVAPFMNNSEGSDLLSEKVSFRSELASLKTSLLLDPTGGGRAVMVDTAYGKLPEEELSEQEVKRREQ